MITQFQGEDRKDAIANHFSLDIVEEDSFIEFIEKMGYSIDDEDSIIENLNLMWLKSISDE